MRHCGDNRPPLATNRSQLTRFHDPIQEDLSQKFHGKVGINGFTVMPSQRLKKTPKVDRGHSSSSGGLLSSTAMARIQLDARLQAH